MVIFRSMKSVAIFSRKGGSGRTTLATHLVRLAGARDISTIAVSLDRMGDLSRWLSEGQQDTHVTAIHSPSKAPRLAADASLVVYDCPPTDKITAEIKPDLWLVPTPPASADFLAEMLGRTLRLLTDAGGEIWVVGWRTRPGENHASVSVLRDAASPFPSARVREQVVPESEGIYRAQDQYVGAWELPFDAGTHALAELCDDVLAHLGLVSPSTFASLARRPVTARRLVS